MTTANRLRSSVRSRSRARAVQLLLAACLILTMLAGAGFGDTRADDSSLPSINDTPAPATLEQVSGLASPAPIDPSTIHQPGPLDTTQRASVEKQVITRGDAQVVAGEVVVLFRDADAYANDAAHRSSGQVIDENPLINMRVLRVNDVDAAIRALQANPNVEYAGPNHVSAGAYDPNDPWYRQRAKSWHLREWGFARGTNVRAAWNTQAGSSTARIVIVDTGVEANHPDLKRRLLRGYNFADNNLNWSDCNGHGTAVAGLAGAITDNARGVAGVDMRGGIYIARVNVGCSNSWSNAAMANAISTTSAWRNTRVINISGGGTFNDPAVARAIALARSRGVVVVAAAGNSSTNVPFYPAANDGVLAVGATTQTAQRASFSNWGWPNVNVSAPGEGICTTALIANGRYTCGWNGTSFASPIVAGIAMLVRAQYPAISEGTVRAQIEWAAWNPERGCWNCYSNNVGYGIVQAYAAVTSRR